VATGKDEKSFAIRRPACHLSMPDSNEFNDLYFFGQGHIHSNPRHVSIIGYEFDQPLFVQFSTTLSQTSTQTRVYTYIWPHPLNWFEYLGRSIEIRERLPFSNGPVVRLWGLSKPKHHDCSRNTSRESYHWPKTYTYGQPCPSMGFKVTKFLFDQKPPFIPVQYSSL
jgi:hypothetical protein